MSGSEPPPPGSPIPGPNSPEPDPNVTQPIQVPPTYPTPNYAQSSTPTPTPTQYPTQQMPATLGAAHRPGAIPLRPLGLGDLYDGAFRIIRTNPGATVGASVLVTAVAMLIPLLMVLVATQFYGDLPGTSSNPFEISSDEQVLVASEALVGQVVAGLGSLLGAVVQAIGLMLVTGMIAHVVAAAVLGNKLSLGQAWAATKGRRWKLIGLSLALFLFFALLIGVYAGAIAAIWFATESGAAVGLSLVTLPFLFIFIAWLWIRIYYVAVPPLMLEKTTLAGAVRRNYHLTKGQFWRTFGIALLTVLLTSIASGMLTFPFTFAATLVVAGVDGDVGLIASTLIQSISTIVSAAFVAPFTAAVACLQYVDLRMRREAFDLQLMSAANSRAPGAPLP